MRAGTAESYQERVQRVLVHIQSHLDGPLSLDELAGVAHFSPFHFHRIFRGMVGESVKEHVRRLRLERAARRLRQTEAPVTDIAFEAGYESHEAFTRAFRSAFGEPPSSFRENRSAGPSESPAPGPLPSGGAPLEVRVKRIGPLRVAFARHVGPYPEVGEAWGRLMAWAGRKGLLGPSFRAIGVVHDDVEITPPQALRYDAALALGAGVQPEGDIGVQELPLAEYASAVHRGPYDRLFETYARLCGEWLPASRRELAAAPALEIYRNSPLEARPEELITEIHLPLADQ